MMSRCRIIMNSRYNMWIIREIIEECIKRKLIVNNNIKIIIIKEEYNQIIT
jgi:hypothetical protein